MKDPRELLALLATKVQKFSNAPGGIPELTPEDMAQALGIIRSDDARILMRVKYGGDTRFLHDLDLRLYLKAIEFFEDRSGLPKGEYVRSMCQMAISEFMDDHTCPSCQGTSEQIAENLRAVLKNEVCSTCHDTGKVYPTEHTRARIIGIHPKIWLNVEHKYRRIQGVLWQWEGEAIGDLHAALEEVTA